MSNGEVKRIKVYHLRETFCPRALLVADESPMPDHESFLIQAEDHDRIVAKKDGELLTYYRMAASGVWIESKEYDEILKTIAKQKCVIEKSRELYRKAITLLDEVSTDKTFSVDDVLARYDAELAATKNGEL